MGGRRTKYVFIGSELEVGYRIDHTGAGVLRKGERGLSLSATMSVFIGHIPQVCAVHEKWRRPDCPFQM